MTNLSKIWSIHLLKSGKPKEYEEEDELWIYNKGTFMEDVLNFLERIPLVKLASDTDTPKVVSYGGGGYLFDRLSDLQNNSM